MVENNIYLKNSTQGCYLLHINEHELQFALIDIYDTHRLGDIYCGRIIQVEPTYAWVEVGAQKPALLKRNKQKWFSGRIVTVRITREPIKTVYEYKGPQVMLADTTEDITASPVPQLLYKAQPQWITYLNSLQNLQNEKTIFINNFDLFQQVQQYSSIFDPHIRLVLKQDDTIYQHIQHYWDEILGCVHPIPQGGHIILEETAALSVFDINTSAIDDYSSSRHLSNPMERLRFNQQAFKVIIKLIELRQLSGIIMIDPLRLDNYALQNKFKEFIYHEIRALKDLRMLGVTPGGLIELCRKVTGPSLKTRSTMIKVK